MIKVLVCFFILSYATDKWVSATNQAGGLQLYSVSWLDEKCNSEVRSAIDSNHLHDHNRVGIDFEIQKFNLHEVTREYRRGATTYYIKTLFFVNSENEAAYNADYDRVVERARRNLENRHTIETLDSPAEEVEKSRRAVDGILARMEADRTKNCMTTVTTRSDAPAVGRQVQDTEYDSELQ